MAWPGDFAHDSGNLVWMDVGGREGVEPVMTMTLGHPSGLLFYPENSLCQEGRILACTPWPEPRALRPVVCALCPAPRGLCPAPRGLCPVACAPWPTLALRRRCCPSLLCVCVHAGRKAEVWSAPPTPVGRRLRGLLPSLGGGFTFFGSTVRQAICLNNPKENHLAELLVSKQFTSLVFKQTPILAPCLVPGRG